MGGDCIAIGPCDFRELVNNGRSSALTGADRVQCGVVDMAIVAPAKTPQPIVRKLYEEIACAVNHPETKNFILRQGAEPKVMAPAELGNYICAEIEK